MCCNLKDLSGVECLGYTQPFAHSVSSEYLADSKPEDLRTAQANYLEKGHLAMARFYVGVSF